MPQQARRKVIKLRSKDGGTNAILQEARDVFFQQAASVADLAGRINDTYAKVIEVLLETEGHVVVFGLGNRV